MEKSELITNSLRRTNSKELTITRAGMKPAATQNPFEMLLHYSFKDGISCSTGSSRVVS